MIKGLLNILDIFLEQLGQNRKIPIPKPYLIDIGILLAQDSHYIIDIGKYKLIFVLTHQWLLLERTIQVVSTRGNLQETRDLVEQLHPLLTHRWSYLERSRDTLVPDEVVVLARLALLILYLRHLFAHEGRGEVGEEQQLVVRYLGELLH